MKVQLLMEFDLKERDEYGVRWEVSDLHGEYYLTSVIEVMKQTVGDSLFLDKGYDLVLDDLVFKKVMP